MAQVAGHVVGRDEELGSLARILDELDRGGKRASASAGPATEVTVVP